MNIKSRLHLKSRTENLEQIVQTENENSLVKPLYNTTNNKNNQKITDYIDLISNFFNDILYIKKSLGKDGNLINVYKLRTMKKNSDHLFSQLAQKGLDETGNLKDDPRITSLGKLLRRVWIDELPQLYNIFIKRNMKMVGIRPMSEDHWKNYPEDIKEKALKYKPGLLGVNYARKPEEGPEAGINVMRKYLEEYEQAELSTDIKYFGIITNNILFNGVRSS